MPKDKDRTLNPAAAARKAEKAKALKKSKTAVQAQRTERLAQRNPHRLESQIAALKDGSPGGADLSGRDAKHLVGLEAELARVKRAREKVGAPPAAVKREGGDDGSSRRRPPPGRGRGGGGYAGLLGKRRRDSEQRSSSSSGDETEEDVRRIPWPRDTPPPIPPPRSRRNANTEPLGRERQRRFGQGGGGDRGEEEGEEEARPDLSLPQKPGGGGEGGEKVAPKTTYEGQAQVRDLRKEATARFMPSVVKRKMNAGKGRGPGGRLLEEEEVSKLEESGYKFGGGGKGDGGDQGAGAEAREETGRMIDAAPAATSQSEREGNAGLDEDEARRLREEEEAFEREIMADTQMEGAKGDADVSAAEPTPPEKRTTMQASVEEQSDEDM